MLRIFSLITPLVLLGCASLTSIMEERKPIGTFTTTLSVDDLVDCMNMNQPPKPPLAIIKPTILWTSPTKFTDGSDVFYYQAGSSAIVGIILNNGVAEMYNEVGFDEPLFKNWREHYSSVCG